MTTDRYRWIVVGMLWWICLFNYADRQAIFSVFPALKSEMELTDVQLGIIGGAFMWVYAASAPFAGWVADRFSRKSLILGGLIFWSVVTLATAYCREYWQLVAVRALEGLGESVYFPASMSLLSDYHGPKTRSRAMSIHQSSVYAGTIAGGTLAGFMAQYYGWRSSFHLFGWLGIALAIVLIAALKEPPRSQPVIAMNQEPAKGLFSHPMSIVLVAVFVGANFVASVFLTWLPSFLNRKFSMTLAMAGFSSTAYLQIASVLGVISGGFLADKLARQHRGGRMITQAIGLFLGIPFLFLTGWTLSVTVLVLAMAGFGYFKGLYDANIWASLYDVVPVARRATAVGVMNSVGWLGAGVAPVAIAAMSERYGMSASISATSAIYLLFGCLMALGIALWMRGAPDSR
jgi:MFS family permease